ncbi:MAG: methyltransferase [Oscillochloris sp.]|nr:methyltransferase [Oscillochloris sp.]
MVDPYQQIQEWESHLLGAPLRIAGKAGVPFSTTLAPGVELCAAHLHPAATERIAVFGGGIAPLGVVLSRLSPQGRVRLCEPHSVASDLARRTLERNGCTNAAIETGISLLPEGAEQFERVILLAPQSRALARRWIVEAAELLCPGGKLHIAGANNQGVRSLVGDAEAVLGPGKILAHGGGARLAEFRRPETFPKAPDWAQAPGIAPGSWIRLELGLPGGPLELRSLPGIFSADHLDPGTAFLLAHLEIPSGAQVLDVGCGYGPIGVAAAQLGAAHVDLSDVNLLAVAAATANVAALGIPAAVFAGDALDPLAGHSYDLIVSNPPFHAGRSIDPAMTTAFIKQSRAHLKPGGRLILVANSFLPYDRLMREQGLQVRITADDRRYRVIIGEM